MVKRDLKMVRQCIQLIIGKEERSLRNGKRIVRFMLERIFLLRGIILNKLIVELYIVPHEDTPVAKLYRNRRSLLRSLEPP